MQHEKYLGQYIKTISRVYTYHYDTLIELDKKINNWNGDQNEKNTLVNEQLQMENDLYKLHYMHQLFSEFAQNRRDKKLLNALLD